MGQQVCRYLIVIEKSNGAYSAYAPDLAGCVASGATREEAEANIQKAIESLVCGLLDRGEPIPEPRSVAEYVAIEECDDC